MFTISPITSGSIKRFFKKTRAVISLYILISLYVLSLCAELIANDKPLLISYNGKLYFFSAYIHYSDNTFGGKFNTEAQYIDLAKTHRFTHNKKNFIIFPPIPYNPYTSRLKELSDIPPTPPDLIHILGTDTRGLDVFALLLYGFRISMSFALILLALEIIIGMSIFALHVYFGRLFDITVNRFIEILSTLPFLYIIIFIGNVIGRGFIILIITMSIFNWIGLYNYIRTEFLKIKQYQFIDAAKTLGASHGKIFFSEILPHILVPIFTFVPFSLIASISVLTGLDYLGFGLPEHTPSWGELMRQGMEYLPSYWLSVFPFLILFLTLLLLTFVIEGLREALNPKKYINREK